MEKGNMSDTLLPIFQANCLLQFSPALEPNLLWNLPSRVDVVLRGRPTKSLTPRAPHAPGVSALKSQAPRDSPASTLLQRSACDPMWNLTSCGVRLFCLIGIPPLLWLVTGMTERCQRSRKDSPNEGQGASSGWLPGCLPVSARSLHQLAFRGWSTNEHVSVPKDVQTTRTVRLQCIGHFISLSNTIPPSMCITFLQPRRSSH